MREGEVTRRRLMALGAAAGAGLLVRTRGAGAAGFADTPAGWGGAWACSGVANLRVSGGVAVLEAGTDVFPADPRPVAFLVDRRFRDGSVRAVIAQAGSAVGVVLRRVGPTDHYAAVYDGVTLTILRRSGTSLVTLAQTAVVGGAAVIELSAVGAAPTALVATLTSTSGAVFTVRAQDAHGPLQRAGDPGVLGQARTLFPSAGPSVFPALGNVHLLPYGVQEGEAFLQTPVGAQVLQTIRRDSTVAFHDVTVSTKEAPAVTPASVLAATTGVPRTGGARLHVAADLPARVVIEVSSTPGFERPRRVASGSTGAFDAFTANVRGLAPGSRVHWRATLQRAGSSTVGPVRSFTVLPGPNDPRPVTLAVGACASQFGPLFDDLARADPDVFVWQGDLNYPDTVGPLAQTASGYAGIWRDFLANPRLARVFARSAFAAMRDDHDYATQDSNALTIPRTPWGVGPWDALMGTGVGYRFSAGVADVWVLDQRRFKSDPAAPDDAAKTLLGARQKAWLLDGLRSSRAPFKIVCSPCTVFMRANARDGNWAAGFTHERDELLRVIDAEVSGRVVFLTGDTHLTGVFEDGARFEARACPMGIPVPNDITISDPQAASKLRDRPGVLYADERCHYALVRVRGEGDTATLDLELRREDGAAPYRRRFTQPLPAVELGLRIEAHDVRVGLDRPGLVRVRAMLDRRRVLDRVVRFERAGARRLRLRLPQRRHGRLTVTARFRSTTGRTVLKVARRTLGR